MKDWDNRIYQDTQDIIKYFIYLFCKSCIIQLILSMFFHQ